MAKGKGGKGGGKPVKFGGNFEKDKQAAKDKVDKGAAKLEQERGTHGHGTRGSQ